MWDAVVKGNKTSWSEAVEFVLNTFGTALSCNRFAVGEVVEYATTEFLRSIGVDAVCLASEARIDVRVNNVAGVSGISSKLVTTGTHVVLSNSQRKTATDLTLHPTILFLEKEWWFLDPATIASHGVDYKPYIKNTGDSVQLSFKLLGELKTKGYPYRLNYNLNYDREACERKATSEVLFQMVKDLHHPDTKPEIKAYLKTKIDGLLCRRVTVSDYSAPAEYASYTVKLLKEICKKRGLKGYSSKKSADLVAMLEKYDETKAVTAAPAAVAVAMAKNVVRMVTAPPPSS
jgi:hypothetical protein